MQTRRSLCLEDYKMNSKKVAMVYDADYTILKEDHPNLILRERGVDIPSFWKNIDKIQYSHKKEYPDSNIDGYYLNYIAKQSLNPESAFFNLSIEELERIGKQKMRDIFFPGIPEFFENVNALDKNVEISHNIVSLGVYHMLKASDLGKYIDRFFAYTLRDVEPNGVEVVGTTSSLEKDSALKKISRGKLYGALERGFEYPVENMIYFGDGKTDEEAFKLVKRNGGLSVCVFSFLKKDAYRQASKLKGIVDYIFPADYRRGSELFRMIEERVGQV